VRRRTAALAVLLAFCCRSRPDDLVVVGIGERTAVELVAPLSETVLEVQVPYSYFGFMFPFETMAVIGPLRSPRSGSLWPCSASASPSGFARGWLSSAVEERAPVPTIAKDRPSFRDTSAWQPDC
jgi:hypothetical protein